MTRKYDVIQTQSCDGEVHFIIIDLKVDMAKDNVKGLNEIEIREFMKVQAEKPLNLSREYE